MQTACPVPGAECSLPQVAVGLDDPRVTTLHRDGAQVLIPAPGVYNPHTTRQRTRGGRRADAGKGRRHPPQRCATDAIAPAPPLSQWLREHPGYYDVVIVDSSDPVCALYLRPLRAIWTSSDPSSPQLTSVSCAEARAHLSPARSGVGGS